MNRPTNCADCGRKLVSQWQWNRATAEQRAAWRRQGTTKHLARGLCSTDHRKRQRHGTLEDQPRVTRPAADTLEDWAELEAQGYTRKQAAERMGITFAALEQAITRARRAERETVAA